MAILLRSTKALEHRIDQYLDAISEGMLVFADGLANYLDHDMERLGERIRGIKELERRADNLRREIEQDLYTQSLIPEHRGDVLGLLETIDDLIDSAWETLNQFSIENPYIPEELNDYFTELGAMATQAGETVVLATRAFFKNVSAVKDHLHKTYHYEKQADKVADRLQRAAFQSTELDLPQKMHLRFFTLYIDRIADDAEAVADRLTIYSIKRTI